MKQSKFTESQIVSAIAAYEGGKNADDIVRELLVASIKPTTINK